MPDPFNLPDFLPYRLAVLADRVSRRLLVEYQRSHGLNVAEWRVLAHLQSGSEMSVRDIHARVSLEKPRVSRAVSRLERAGFVRKDRGQGDGRLIAISLTDAGHTALAEILPDVSAIEKGLLDALTKEERDVFSVVIDKLHATLDADPATQGRPE